MTIWLNGFAVVAAVVLGLVELDFIRNIPGIQSFIIGLTGVLNVLLRVFKTIAPVTIAGKILAPSRELG